MTSIGASGKAGPEAALLVPRPIRWALLLAIGAVALWLRVVPLTLPGLDPPTQELFRFDDAAGHAHVYLGDYDSYVWLRAARNYLRHGTTCDAVLDGECRDTLTHAPVGREMRYGRSMHVVAIVGMHRLMTALRPEYPLSASAYLAAVLLGLLVILPAFGIGRRLGGDLAGIATSAAIAWNPFLLTRSSGSDNDVWNVLLPVCLVWAIARALTATTLMRACAWSVVAAGFVGMHAGTWSGWPLSYGIVLLALVAHLLTTAAQVWTRAAAVPAERVRHGLRTPAALTVVYYVACFVSTSIAGTEHAYFAVPGEMLQKLGSALAVAASPPGGGAGPALQWPNVFEGVAELYRPVRAEIGSAVGGDVARVVGWIGFVLLLLPWRRWRWWHALVAALGGAIVARLLFGAELASSGMLAFLLVPPALALSLRVLLDERDGANTYDPGVALVATIWFLAGAALAPTGARFVLFLVAPFSVVFGHAIGRLHRLLAPRWGARLAVPAVVLAMGVLLMPTLGFTHKLAAHYRPRIDDAWWDTLAGIRAQSPPDTILNLWWDYGYWAKYVAERRVSADGGSLRTRIPYWTGRSLLAADERETVGLLRMLNCGSAASPEREGQQSAFSRLVGHGVAPRDAYDLVLALAVRDRSAASALLVERALSVEAQRDVLAASHCRPPPALLLLSSAQIDLSSWKQLARWRPSSEDAALPSWRRDLLANEWTTCAVVKSGRWVCPVKRGRRAAPSWLRQVALDPGDPSSVRLTLRRPKRPGAELIATPTLVVRAGARDRTETQVMGESPAEVAVLIDESHRRVLVGAHDLIRSTFVHLLFLDGRYARQLRKIDERRGVNGTRVVTWQIEWDGGA